jgi:alpha/beta superfamily hydrolase
MEIIEEQLQFSVAGDMLEAIAAYPETSKPSTAVLVLAPHPQMGGNMGNNVVRHLARRMAESGALTLRFNYRGVGNSSLALPEGAATYDHFQRMEEEQRYDLLLPDALGALALLRSLCDCARTVYVGYSLGGVLAGLLARTHPPDALVSISPPVKKVPLSAFDTDAYPRHFVGGDNDFAFLYDTFQEQYAGLPEPKTFHLLEGADHFFRKEEERVYSAIAHVL